jgi:hypothetical protein
MLTYTATPGTTSAVGFAQTGPATVEVHRFAGAGDDDAITSFTGCTQAMADDPTCVPV